METTKTYNILVVDDQIINLQIIISFLEENPQYNLLQAIQGQAACQIALESPPDLIILDWFMPEMDGIEVLEFLKAHNETRNIPVIFATAVMTKSEHLQKALNTGAVDFLRKPIDKVELHARVRSALMISEYHHTIIEQNIILQNNQIELEAINSELQTANEELQITNENLNESNNKLKSALGMLYESEHRYRDLANATFEGLLFHNGEIIVDANDRFLEMTSYKRAALIANTLLQFIDIVDHKIIIDDCNSNEPSNYELNIIRKNHTLINVEVLSKPIKLKNEMAKVVAVRDISDRKKAEELEKLRLEEKLKVEQHINLLQKDKYESDIDHKNRQLSSSTLHVLNKNKVLRNIEQTLEEIVSKLDKPIVTKFKKLRGIIDDNLKLDNDWSDFKIHFDSVHPDFFDRVKERCDNLSQNDQKHCAYMRIGLQTKEIARLFNINARSVQIARYRIKKKFDLPEEVNLVDYLMEL